MMRDDFAVFILTHGRPDRQHTLRALKKGNYTGKVYLVIDDEDETEDAYRAKYGDMIIQFCKAEIAATLDSADLSTDRRTIVYARNACFRIARDLGLRYFLELDDDYNDFSFRYDRNGLFASTVCKQLDRLFEAMLEFLDTSGAITVAFAQNGDFVGGLKSNGNHAWQKKIWRKAMNTFFCRVDRPFKFVGRINEDVNTYTLLGNQGKLLMTACYVAIQQKETQTNKGGMTDVYLESGTYVKSFYTVIFSPQATRVMRMGGDTEHRIHHRIEWDLCVPKILNERWRKPRGDAKA